MTIKTATSSVFRTWRKRVESGVFTPVVVEDGPRRWLYVSLYGAQGNDLARMPFEPARFLLGEAEPSRLAR